MLGVTPGPWSGKPEKSEKPQKFGASPRIGPKAMGLGLSSWVFSS
jgi:hypothetical protein